jgi:hypothetical protein
LGDFAEHESQGRSSGQGTLLAGAWCFLAQQEDSAFAEGSDEQQQYGFAMSIAIRTARSFLSEVICLAAISVS